MNSFKLQKSSSNDNVSEEPNNKVFISGLPGLISSEELSRYFDHFIGFQTSCRTPNLYKATGVGKGYAVLELPNQEVKNTILQIRSFIIRGRIVHVMDHLSPKQRRQQKEDIRCRRVFVTAKNLCKIDLRSVLSYFGDVEDAYPIRDARTGRFQNYGFVLFRDSQSAKYATLQGSIVSKNCKIIICPFQGQDTKKGVKQRSSGLDFDSSDIPPTKQKYFKLRGSGLLSLPHKKQNIRLNKSEVLGNQIKLMRQRSWEQDHNQIEYVNNRRKCRTTTQNNIHSIERLDGDRW